MARTFTKNTANHLDLTAGKISNLLSKAAGYSVHALVKFTSIANSNKLVGALIDTSGHHGIDFEVDSGSHVKLAARSANGDSATSTVTGVTTVTIGGAHSVGCVCDYTNKLLTLYLDGSIDAVAAAANFSLNSWGDGSPSTVDRIGCNASTVATTNQVDGVIAEVAIGGTTWGPEIFYALAAGVPAPEVCPQLIFYVPLRGDATETDRISNVGLTIVGTLAATEHPITTRQYHRRRESFAGV